MMKNTPRNVKIKELFDWIDRKGLLVNQEYQRAGVWNVDQKKRLIDSLFRGYPLPLIYIHKLVCKGLDGDDSHSYEIIDGQQRLDALHRYKGGEFALFDPKLEAAKARFPRFVQDSPCAWAGKKFDELSDELQEEFLQRELPIALIETDIPGEARDLFVRLQAGTPLDPQQKRDALPGNMNEFIRKTAGKPKLELPGYLGHAFYRTAMAPKKNDPHDRLRAFTGQWLLLFLGRREHGPEWFCDVGAKAVDDLYYEHIDFDLNGEPAKRFIRILNVIEVAFNGQKFAPLRGHDAMHLILLVDSLMDDYAPSWEEGLFGAFEQFTKRYVESKKEESPNDPYWVRYGILVRTGSDSGKNIKRRHEFFSDQMRGFMPDLKMKDSNRLFGELDKQIVYARANKVCAECGGKVDWNDAEYHHVVEHHKGGATHLDNCALVHKTCHPKGEAAVKAFEEKWSASKMSDVSSAAAFDPTP